MVQVVKGVIKNLIYLEQFRIETINCVENVFRQKFFGLVFFGFIRPKFLLMRLNVADKISMLALPSFQPMRFRSGTWSPASKHCEFPRYSAC